MKKIYCKDSDFSNMKKVYCKKDFINDYHDRQYYKGRIYYIDICYYFENCSVFVYLDNTRQKGLWISSFDEYFTYDEKVFRHLKLERIINE